MMRRGVDPKVLSISTLRAFNRRMFVFIEGEHPRCNLQNIHSSTLYHILPGLFILTPRNKPSRLSPAGQVGINQASYKTEDRGAL
jgi:hypothetical protein